MNKTIFRYMFFAQLRSMFFVSISVFFIIFLFDFVEVMRRLPASNFSEIFFDLQLTFLKTPQTFHEVFHYIYFITATFTLWYMCHSNQITILKSSGSSPQQILFPFISFGISMALFWVLLLQPVGLICAQKYENIISPENSQNTNENIWINYPGEGQLIHINRINNNLIDGFQSINNFSGEKIFARSGILTDDSVNLEDIVIIEKDGNSKNLPTLKTMRYDRAYTTAINMLSIPAKKRNIYSLLKIITIRDAGKIGLKSYELALHNMLANCCNFILFAIIAAIICFPINRYKSKTNVVIQIITAIIALRFVNGFLETFALSNVLPVWLASWGVVFILLCLSVAVLIWKEM